MHLRSGRCVTWQRIPEQWKRGRGWCCAAARENTDTRSRVTFRVAVIWAACTQVLRRHFPRHALLGEEGGVSGDVNSQYLWWVAMQLRGHSGMLTSRY